MTFKSVLGARFIAGVCFLAALIAFGCSLPLLQPPEYARLAGIVAAILGAFVALAARLVGYKEGLLLPRGALLPVAGLFLAVMVISAADAVIPFSALIATATFLIFPCGCLVVLLSPAPQMTKAAVYWLGGAAIGLLAALAVVQFCFFPNLLVGHRVQWPFANPNAYAALLTLGFFPALGGILTLPKWRRLACFILAALCIAGIVATGSRAILGLTACAALLLIWLAWGSVLERRRMRSFALLALVAASFMWIPAQVPDTSRLAPLLMSPGESQYESLNDRLAIWRGTAAMIAAHPLRGTGIGSFAFFYPQYRLPSDTDSAGLMAHSDPLQFWAEMGVFAPLLFYAFIALSGLRMLRALKGFALDDPRRAEASALFCALAVIVLHAQIDYDFYEASILAAAGPLLGLWLQATQTTNESPPRYWRVNPALAWPGLALLTALILYPVQAALRSEYLIAQAPAHLAAGDVAGFAALVNDAGRVSHSANPRAALLAAAIPIAILEDGKAANVDALRAHANKLLDRAVSENPRLTDIYDLRAHLLLTQKNRDGAMAQCRAALNLDPQDTKARLFLSQMLRDGGDDKQALLVLKDGMRWPAVSRGLTGDGPVYFNWLERLGRAQHDDATVTAAKNARAAMGRSRVQSILPAGLPG